MTELQPQSVVDYQSIHESNTNSALTSIFQTGQASYEERAISAILMKCLEEPTFNQLRTQEQLGYVVSAWYESIDNVCFGNFVI